MDKLDLVIINNDVVYHPILAGDIKWSLERQGAPGKLTFEVVKDEIINFQEGNKVLLNVDGTDLFLGYVFEKKRNKSETISVTAYDQLRYLKNKDSFIFENKKASDFIIQLCNEFELIMGEISDTEHVIPSQVLDNKTLFDMIQETLDETLLNTKKIFVLYDDFGKITLKDAGDMKLNICVYNEVLEDFDYTSSIDSNTYNQIKLAYDNKSTGLREIYVAKDSDNIEKWGLLQYYEKVNNPENAINKVNSLLTLYNKKTRRLSLKNVFGDIRVRGGSSISVSLNLGDIQVNQYFICESVTHTFKEGMHFMDISLKGSDFYE